MDFGASAFSYLYICLNYMFSLFTSFTLFQYINISCSNSFFCELKNVQNKKPITSSKENRKGREKKKPPILKQRQGPTLQFLMDWCNTMKLVYSI